MQISGFAELAELIKTHSNKTIWCYTGYTYEYCKDHFPEILELSDILVDGMYDCAKRDISLAFRGSSNQRIIDLKTREDISSKL